MTSITMFLPIEILSADALRTVAPYSIWMPRYRSSGRMQPACAGNAKRCLCIHGRQIHGLEHELPDGDDGADNQKWIDQHLEQVATFFFRAHQKRVGRFVLVFWLIDCFC